MSSGPRLISIDVVPWGDDGLPEVVGPGPSGSLLGSGPAPAERQPPVVAVRGDEVHCASAGAHGGAVVVRPGVGDVVTRAFPAPPAAAQLVDAAVLTEGTVVAVFDGRRTRLSRLGLEGVAGWSLDLPGRVRIGGGDGGLVATGPEIGAAPLDDGAGAVGEALVPPGAGIVVADAQGGVGTVRYDPADGSRRWEWTGDGGAVGFTADASTWGRLGSVVATDATGRPLCADGLEIVRLGRDGTVELTLSITGLALDDRGRPWVSHAAAGGAIEVSRLAAGGADGVTLALPDESPAWRLVAIGPDDWACYKPDPAGPGEICRATPAGAEPGRPPGEGESMSWWQLAPPDRLCLTAAGDVVVAAQGPAGFVLAVLAGR